MLQAYLDIELSPTETTAVEKHLAECDACRSRCDRRREAIAAFRAEFSKLNPGAVEIPVWSPAPLSHERSGRRAVSKPGVRRITWLQGMVTVAAAAAAVWLAVSPSHREFHPTDDPLDRLQAQIPPVGEDPQRMYREQCLVITVFDRSVGSVERYIASPETNRVTRESLAPGHSVSDDSSKLKKGI